MNALQIFTSEEFGRVRVIEENGKVLFRGKDIAVALGYVNTKDALKRHRRGVVKRYPGVQTGIRADGTPAMQSAEMNFIPEGDLYRLIVNSRLPKAQEFESWVFDTVLPSLRRDGFFLSSKAARQLLKDTASLEMYQTFLDQARELDDYYALQTKSARQLYVTYRTKRNDNTEKKSCWNNL